MEKKSVMIIGIFLSVILISSFVSAGWFGDLWAKITGRAVEEETECGNGICEYPEDSDSCLADCEGVGGGGGSSKEGKCIDEDGEDYFVKGTTTAKFDGQNSFSTEEDVCIFEGNEVESCDAGESCFLKEYVCENEEEGSGIAVPCTYNQELVGCNDGACVKTPKQINSECYSLTELEGDAKSSAPLTSELQVQTRLVQGSQTLSFEKSLFEKFGLETEKQIRNFISDERLKSVSIQGDVVHLRIEQEEDSSFEMFISERRIDIRDIGSYIIKFKKSPLGLRSAEKVSAEGSSEKQIIDLDEYQEDAIKDLNKELNKKYFVEKIVDVFKSAEDEKEVEEIRRFRKVFNGIAVESNLEDIKKLKNSEYVEEIYPNVKVKATMMDSIPLIDADDVWDVGYTGEGITIAIIDTGVDYTHPDLGGCFGEGCRVVSGYNFVCDYRPYEGCNVNDPIDDNGHGTHCAGIVGANGVLKGVAPDSEIYAYKVLNEDGYGDMYNIMAAIDMAVDPDDNLNTDDGVDIISMSLGGGGNPDDPMSEAVDNAVDLGVIVVVAAGNDGPWEQSIGSPGTARKALTVGATYKKDYVGEYWGDENPKADEITSFSSRGPVIWPGGVLIKPDIVAPGAIICSARYDNIFPKGEHDLYKACLDEQHVQLAGTSMATPMVAGAVALVKQALPDLTAEEIKSLIETTSLDLGYEANVQGNGKINLLDALDSKLIFSENDIVFDNFEGEPIVKKISIKNIGGEEITLSLKNENAIDSFGEVACNLISFNDNIIVIPPNSEKDVLIQLNFPEEITGIFTGKIVLNDGFKDYSLPYIATRVSYLTLKMDEEPLPYFFYHTNDLKYGGWVSQGWDFIGNEYTSMVVPGEYTVYTMNDFSDDPEEKEYILADVIDVPIDSSVEKTFELSEGKLFTLEAKSNEGEQLILYDWTRGVAIYKNKFDFCNFGSKDSCENNKEGLFCDWDDDYGCRNRGSGMNFYGSSFGDREIYISNNPDNDLEMDITLKYFGVPEDEN